ncbi:hypothetical protein F5B18DRAFT_616060 [Nemania serpens]|nr:hypothetical protein F5B18DRAFT_616060 [Nemania serpens]
MYPMPPFRRLVYVPSLLLTQSFCDINIDTVLLTSNLMPIHITQVGHIFLLSVPFAVCLLPRCVQSRHLLHIM